MHLLIVVVMGLLQSAGPSSIQQPSRIQPIPRQLVTETNRKPAIQDLKSESGFVLGEPVANTSTWQSQGKFKIGDQATSQGPGRSVVIPLQKKSGLAVAGNGTLNDQTNTIGIVENGGIVKNGQATSQFLPAREGQIKPLRAAPGNPVVIQESSSNGRFGGASQEEVRSIDGSPSSPATPSFVSPSRAVLASPPPQNTGGTLDRLGERAAQGAAGQGSPAYAATPPAKLQEVNRLPEISVGDDTFDPKLKFLAEQILESVPRSGPNRLSLQRLLVSAVSAAERKTKVVAYWRGFASQLDAEFAAQELKFLQEIGEPRSVLEQSLWLASVTGSEARLAETAIFLAKARSELGSLSSQTNESGPIVFADLPWVGKYRTSTNLLVKSGRFDPKIRNVDDALPAMRDLIHLRAVAVANHMRALSNALVGYRNDQVRLETVLSFHRELRDQRIAFLGGVRDYNIAIANYAISVFPDAMDAETVARMLVDTTRTLPIDVKRAEENLVVQPYPNVAGESGNRQPGQWRDGVARPEEIRDTRVQPASGFEQR
ncbi:MAG: hypothetical protein P8M80_08030 [Pirellulaceae bacterium]|nr:hypothetical protein [Pirellulaceae bacterium]